MVYVDCIYIILHNTAMFLAKSKPCFFLVFCYFSVDLPRKLLYIPYATTPKLERERGED
jgi:hypothetical protein